MRQRKPLLKHLFSLKGKTKKLKIPKTQGIQKKPKLEKFKKGIFGLGNIWRNTYLLQKNVDILDVFFRTTTHTCHYLSTVHSWGNLDTPKIALEQDGCLNDKKLQKNPKLKESNQFLLNLGLFPILRHE